jgi:hypothetical protein
MNVVKEARNLIAFVLDDGNNVPIIFCTHGIGGFIAKVVSFYPDDGKMNHLHLRLSSMQFMLSYSMSLVRIF